MKIIIVVVICTVLYIVSMVKIESFRNSELSKFDSITISSDGSNNISISKEEIVINVIGEVKNPGKYTFSYYATFDDLIKKCGLTSNSDSNCINLECPLENNMTYYIPKMSSSKISINSASKEELDLLPGIGEALADRIIQYRTQKQFLCLEDIKKVDGIKELLFNKIKDNIKLWF